MNEQVRKKITVITLVIAILLGSFFTLKWWLGGRSVQGWSFIPANALLVVETSSPLAELDNLKQQSFWPLYSLSGFGNNLQQRADYLNKMLVNSGEPNAMFQDKKMLISLHVTSKKNIDFLFIAPIASSTDRDVLGNITEKFRANNGIRYATRELDGFEIQEFTDKLTRETFSYIVHKNFIIGSFTGYLVEDVIRTIKAGDKASFAPLQEALFKKGENKAISNESNIYLNYEQFTKYASYLVTDEFGTNFAFIADLVKVSGLGNKKNHKEFQFTGYSAVSTTGGIDFLNVFKWQTAPKPTVQNLIPNNTAYAYYWGFENGKNLRTSLNEYWIANQKPIAWAETNRQYHLDISNFYNWFGKQIAYIGFETQHGNEIDKALLIQASDVVRAYEDLNRVSGLLGGVVHASSVDGSPEIRKIAITEFPSRLLGVHFKGFTECYYARVQDFIVFANHPDNILHVHNSYLKEDVWSKNPQNQALFATSAQAGNVTLVANSSKIWPFLQANLNPLHVKSATDWEKQLKSFELLSLSLTNMGDKIATNLHLTYQTQKIVLAQADSLAPATAEEDIAQDVKTVNIGTLVNRPVLNPININEINTDYFVQGANNALYCFTNNHEKVFEKPLDSPLTSNIYALDFNHFAFTTNAKVYIIDRKGDNFKQYPVSYSGNLADLSVLDYDKSRNYRLFVTDKSGTVFLLDKTGLVPATWVNLKYSSALTSSFNHVTLGGKDYLYFIETAGNLHVITRKGEPYVGFPVKLGARASSGVVVEKGTNAETSIMRTITNDGIFYMHNFVGKQLLKKQLVRPSKASQFKIQTATNNQAMFVITCADESQIQVIDHNLATLFTIPVTGGLKSKVAYYHFGADKAFYLVYSPDGTTLLYDSKGNIVDKKAFNASGMPLLREENDEIQLVIPQMNVLNVKGF
jgi:hypothetical protein